VKVTDVMTREFEVVRENASLLEAMRHFRECPLVGDEVGIKCLVVLDGQDRFVGVLTQSDVVGEVLFPYFVRNLADSTGEQRTIQEEDFANLAAWAKKARVRDVMTRSPVTLEADEDVFEAADVLISRKVKSIPILQRGRVVGIVYRSALYKRIAESILARPAI
jgi:CBS domain-containing protein